jgi:hypothetical protein
MEDSSPSQNHNGQLGPSSGGSNVGNKQSDEGNQRTQYSIPGILHFIQHEWARFEMERSQWEVDRAELQVIIVILRFVISYSPLFNSSYTHVFERRYVDAKRMAPSNFPSGFFK